MYIGLDRKEKEHQVGTSPLVLITGLDSVQLRRSPLKLLLSNFPPTYSLKRVSGSLLSPVSVSLQNMVDVKTQGSWLDETTEIFISAY